MDKKTFQKELETESHQIFMALARLHVKFGPLLAASIYDTLIKSILELKEQAIEEVAKFKRAELQVTGSELLGTKDDAPHAP